MGTNQNNESKISKLKINNAFTPEDGEILNIDALMNVEGGVDCDEDGCISKQCSSQAVSCYSGV